MERMPCRSFAEAARQDAVIAIDGIVIVKTVMVKDGKSLWLTSSLVVPWSACPGWVVRWLGGWVVGWSGGRVVEWSCGRVVV